MAITATQYIDLLYKSLVGVAKTDLPANKSASNEAIASPLLNRGDQVWTEAGSIPTTATSVSGIVQAYIGTSKAVAVADTTAQLVSGVYPSWKTNLTNWVPPQFDTANITNSYRVKIYYGASGLSDPATSGGTQIFADGSGGTGEWYFDYSAGILNFIGGTIPAGMTGASVIYVYGYRYIGKVGVTNLPSVSVSGTSTFDLINALTGNFTATTTATSTTTGALIVSGGAGIGGNLYVGGEIVAQKLTIELTTVTTTLVQTDDIIKTTNATQSNSTDSGALQVSGGAGIGGNLYVGGTIYGTATNATTATNADRWTTARTITLSGDLSGNVVVDGSQNVTLTATIQADSVALGTDTTGIYVASGAVSGYGLSGSASTEGSTFTVTSNATSTNANSTVVFRDASGNFAAGTITANLTGVATTATNADKWTAARTITFTGDTTGTFSIDGSADVTNVNLTIQPNSVTLGTDTTGDYVATGAVSGYGLSGSASGETSTFTITSNATSTNNVSTVVFRDASGNFSAGTITGNLIGTATNATTATNADKWTTARTITLSGDLSGNVVVNGSQNVTLTATIQADSVALGTDTTGIYVASGAVSGYGLSGSANTEGSTFTVASNATSSNLVSTVVFRNANGDFRARNIVLEGTSVSTSTTTGALQIINGGIGVGGNVWANQLRQTNPNVSIGSDAGSLNQGANSIGIGSLAGAINQGTAAVAVGRFAGETTQGIFGVAVGANAGQTEQKNYAVAVGANAGGTSQSTSSIAIGWYAGNDNQNSYAIAIGQNAGEITQSEFGVAIGDYAGNDTQGNSAIAIGNSAGQNTQTAYAVAIGTSAGQTTQGLSAVAIGTSAGQITQGLSAVAIGDSAGYSAQGDNAIAIGYTAGTTTQGLEAVAIGLEAGQTGQGTQAVAIGKQAGTLNQPANSVIINASGSALNGSNTGTYITPIRADSSTSATNILVYYNPVTKELTTNTSVGVTSITAGTDTAISAATGAVTVWNNSTLQSVTSRGATTNQVISITNTTSATSTITGALQVVGGVGVGGNLYVGGEIVAEKLTIQLTTVTTTLIQTDDVIKTTNTTSSTSTTTGALQVTGGAGIGGNLHVGGNIVVKDTAMVADASTTSVLTSAVTLDSFAAATYRSAQYLISVSNAGLGEYQTSDILIIHNGTNSFVQATSVFSGNKAIMNFNTTISGGNVLLQGTGSGTGANPNIVKIQKTYITI